VTTFIGDPSFPIPDKPVNDGSFEFIAKASTAESVIEDGN